MSTSLTNDYLQLAGSLYKEGFNMDQITLQLREKGAPDNLLQEALHYLKQLRINRKRNTGFACCGIGITFLTVGCMLTLMLFNSGGDIKWAMYGLTSLGIIFTMKGMVDLLGW